jgi:homopolymeric O-antigen transport system permease protein
LSYPLVEDPVKRTFALRPEVRTNAPYHLRIRASTHFARFDPSELWQFRGLLGALALRDVKLRYRQTALGVGWVLLQPLLASGILAFVFGTVAGLTRPGRTSVFVFVLAGFIGWTVFNATFVRTSSSVLQQSALIVKVYFPRIILPASAVVSALLDASIASALFFLVASLSGTRFGWQVLTFPIWMAVVVILAFGLGLMSAAMSVRFRDVQHITPVLMQILFYASPIAYQASAVPDKWRTLFLINPLAPLFEALRWSLLREGNIRPLELLNASFGAVAVLGVGIMLFRRAEREFADLI